MGSIFFKNRRGISLIEVLVVTGILGILSVAMMTMTANQDKANKSTQLTIEANGLYNQIERYMLDSKTCGDTLNNLVIVPGGTLPVTSIVKNGVTLISTTPPGNVIGNLAVKSMTLRRNQPLANELEFNLVFEKVNKTNSIGSDTFNRPMKLQGIFHATVVNRIIGCFSQLESAVSTAIQQSCDSMCPAIPATVPSACWNAVTQKCNMPAPPTARLIYQSNTSGLTLTQPSPQSFNCSNCGSNCNPCPSGWTQLSISCNRSNNQCGLRKWRNCSGTCINGSPTPVGKIFPP